MELWDAYDSHGNKLPGVTLRRGEPVPEGMYHLVSEVLVRHTDGSYLLMRRDPGKHRGGLWEATAGGSALRGEDAPACAGRELEEETGLSGRLIPLGALRHEAPRTWYALYLCQTNREKDGVRLQPGETADYHWVSREELLELPMDALAANRTRMFL